MRVQGKHFTHEWEKPVKAILNFFELNNVTIIGASLGGMLAPRAAAFDKRIGRVIAWSVFTNFMNVLISTQPSSIQKLTRFCLKFHLGFFINFAFNNKAKRGNELVKWGLSHGMYAYEAKSPYEYIKKIDQYQIIDIADKIDQDILIIGASKDHFIDYRTVGTEIDALTNVKSLSVRIFTEKENGEGHCNVGNPKLCFDTMINWMEQIKQRDKK
jgi:cephalosporin-C deacetylase-like acetyl esterase